MNELKYKIKCNGNIIAAFLFKPDREACMDSMAEAYEDCRFEAVDD